MEVTKELVEREGCYNFYLKEGNKILKIIFGGNLDLYLGIYTYPNTNKELSIEEIKKEIFGELKYIFTITKENYFIYSLFEELYDDIKESRIFIPDDNQSSKIEIDEESNFDFLNYMTEEKSKILNESHKKSESYQFLFDGETIEWHSDDDSYDRADRVIIKKVDDTFVLEFIRPKITENTFVLRTAGYIGVRFRNSGSRYDPYNIIFMRMFNKLQEYDPEYHQMHIEEISYQRKLTLKK